MIAARFLLRLGRWLYSVGERLDQSSQPDRHHSLNSDDEEQEPYEELEDEDHVEGMPEDAPSFQMAGLSERVTSKSMASLRAEAIQLLFALHAGHVIASEILLSRKIGHIVDNAKTAHSGSSDQLRQLNQFITNWTSDAGSLDAAIGLLRQIELPDAPLPDGIEPNAEEAELGRQLLERYEQSFNQQVLEQTLMQDEQ